MTPAPKRARNPQTGEVLILQGGQWVPEPKAAQEPAPAPQAPQPRQGRFVPDAEMDSLASDGLKRDLVQGAQEAGAGVSSAVTMGADDEIYGAVKALMGGDYEQERAKFEAQKQALSQRSSERAESTGMPFSAYGAGQFAGTVATSLAGGGAAQALRGGNAAVQAGRAGGAMASARTAAGAAGVEGAVEGAMNAQPGQRTAGAAMGGAMSLATAGTMAGGGAVARKAGAGLGRLSENLKRPADIARVQSVGVNPAHAHELPGGVEGAAATLRKHGVGKGLFAGNNTMERQAGQAIDQIEAQRAQLAAPAKNMFTDGRRVAAPIRAAAPRINTDRASYMNRKADEFEFTKGQVVEPVPAAYAATAPQPQPPATDWLAHFQDLSAHKQRDFTPSRQTEGGGFVLDQQKPYVYHATPAKNLASIQQHGLDPDRKVGGLALGKNKNRIFFGPEGSQDFWRSNRGEAFGEPMEQLRARATVRPVPGANENILVREHALPPDRIERMNQDGSWSKLDGTPLDPPPMQTRTTTVPRRLSFEELKEGRQEYSPSNWATGSNEAQSGKDISQAFAAEEAALITKRSGPGAGDRYRNLGREEAHLMRARKGLLGGAGGNTPGGRVPLNPYDAARLLTPGGMTGNMKAKAYEGAQSMAGPMGRRATTLGNAAVNNTPAGSILSRTATQKIQEAEYPEDEYFRQYMSNPDFQHSRR